MPDWAYAFLAGWCRVFVKRRPDGPDGKKINKQTNKKRKEIFLSSRCRIVGPFMYSTSLPADVLWGSFVTHSYALSIVGTGSYWLVKVFSQFFEPCNSIPFINVTRILRKRNKDTPFLLLKSTHAMVHFSFEYIARI